eukprot:CAMPEP_0194538316 /NCGR_PEP_ID=MMETSP0253-20130528/77809_1 /TAXON_ID=2966 /ORGANISM="Noctiluca scintillans" /LENGTH=198 /DNA_ID=CAMNT_0039384417 /DNA_START=9 /DNA_END=605 /DNA_ORIENTATION=-
MFEVVLKNTFIEVRASPRHRTKRSASEGAAFKLGCDEAFVPGFVTSHTDLRAWSDHSTAHTTERSTASEVDSQSLSGSGGVSPSSISTAPDVEPYQLYQVPIVYHKLLSLPQAHAEPPTDNAVVKSHPSLGSISHPNDCVPCLFWFKDQCKKASMCKHCHYVHVGQRIKRIKKSKRTRMHLREQGEKELCLPVENDVQ